jgi:hypothetical protein
VRHSEWNIAELWEDSRNDIGKVMRSYANIDIGAMDVDRQEMEVSSYLTQDQRSGFVDGRVGWGLVPGTVGF